jgi:2-dehydro-3-deoxy-D-arabinonate dehydratase
MARTEMRFCSVRIPSSGSVLCSVRSNGDLVPIGRERPFRELAELIAASPTAGSLEEAVEAVGVALTPIASWPQIEGMTPGDERRHLVAPIRPIEVWAAGVTYERSLSARMEESHEPDMYDRVYRSARPELFFKATGPRVIGPNAAVGLRSDSKWQVPEPELALVLGQHGTILGYTLGNDMSSRDIEGENPLYLPQAKIYAGSCAIGPVIVSAAQLRDPYGIEIAIEVSRASRIVFQGTTSTARLHVKLETLTKQLAHDNWIAPGTVLLTGTGIVPSEDFTLQAGDVIEVSSRSIGTLRNHCVPADELAQPDWLPAESARLRDSIRS